MNYNVVQYLEPNNSGGVRGGNSAFRSYTTADSAALDGGWHFLSALSRAQACHSSTHHTAASFRWIVWYPLSALVLNTKKGARHALVYVCTYYRRLLYFTALSLHSLELTLGVALDTPEVHTGMYVDLFYGTKKFETNYIDNTTGYGFCTVHCSRGRRGRNRICR